METTKTQESTIRFFCTGCGQKFSCGPEAAGQVFECPVCQRENTAPSRTAASEPDFDRTRIPGATLKFRCQCCGQKLSIPLEFSDGTFECPSCATEGAVPALNGTAIPADGPITSEERENVLKFFCTSCGQHLLADRDLTGEHISCPICSHFTEIPDLDNRTPTVSPPAARNEPQPQPATATTPVETPDQSPDQSPDPDTTNGATDVTPPAKRPPRTRKATKKTRGLHPHHRIGKKPAAKNGPTHPEPPAPEDHPGLSPSPQRKSLKRKGPKSRKVNGARPSAKGASPAPAASIGPQMDTPPPEPASAPPSTGNHPPNGAEVNRSDPASNPGKPPPRKPKADLLNSLAKLGFEITPLPAPKKRVSDAMED